MLDHTQEVKSSSQTDSAALSSRCLLLRMPSDLDSPDPERGIQGLHGCMHANARTLRTWGAIAFRRPANYIELQQLDMGEGAGWLLGIQDVTTDSDGESCADVRRT